MGTLTQAWPHSHPCALADASLFLEESSLEEKWPPSLSGPRRGVCAYTPPHPQVSLVLSSSLNSLQDRSLGICHSCLWHSTTLGLDLTPISQLAGRCQEPTVAQDSSRLCWSAEKKKAEFLLLRNSQTTSGSSMS